MMIGSLRGHPHIVGFGELFVRDRVTFNFEGYQNDSTQLLALRKRDPVEFLERFVFTGYRDDIRAVGFKAFPEQFDRRRSTRVWEWIHRNRDVKLILLLRENMLASLTSLKIAHVDRRHGIADEVDRSRTTVSLDPDGCLRAFCEREQRNSRVRQLADTHQVLEISYEDLAEHPQRNLGFAQDFLGVDVQSLEITKVKQETRSLREVIDNYDELRTFFSGTKWSRFFEA